MRTVASGLLAKAVCVGCAPVLRGAAVRRVSGKGVFGCAPAQGDRDVRGVQGALWPVASCVADDPRQLRSHPTSTAGGPLLGISP